MTTPRQVTNEDIVKYQRMVNKYIRDMVQKNWNESRTYTGDGEEIMLGNTGMTLNDIRQHLLTEVVFAIQKYDPNYRTKEGKSVLESTFVYQHLFHRCGQLCKRLTKPRAGYGVWHANFESMLEHDEEQV
jgi:hypothetical protein